MQAKSSRPSSCAVNRRRVSKPPRNTSSEVWPSWPRSLAAVRRSRSATSATSSAGAALLTLPASAATKPSVSTTASTCSPSSERAASSRTQSRRCSAAPRSMRRTAGTALTSTKLFAPVGVFATLLADFRACERATASADFNSNVSIAGAGEDANALAPVGVAAKSSKVDAAREVASGSPSATSSLSNGTPPSSTRVRESSWRRRWQSAFPAATLTPGCGAVEQRLKAESLGVHADGAYHGDHHERLDAAVGHDAALGAAMAAEIAQRLGHAELMRLAVAVAEGG
eukprot:scaffold1596_cov302-Pinguiococcus_pyrenoidosus.AAC.50